MSTARRYKVQWWWRVAHWEYWPGSAVYAPIFAYWLFLCLRARSFFFFFASNPSIPFGGWDQESKYGIYNRMNGHGFPSTAFIPKHSTAQEIMWILANQGMQWPLYAKPDIGGMGKGVALVHSIQDMVHLVLNYPIDYIVQAPCEGNEELGIFYVRMPNDARGRITGIVHKQKLILTGDGESNLYQLAKADGRARLQIDWIFTQDGIDAQHVLPLGEKLTVSSIGNHARGSKFVDISAQCTNELLQSVQAISAELPHFCFGRLDVMCSSVQDALQGGKLHVIEVNGAGSEPTHMYDPKHSIFVAWQQIIKHWHLLYKVSSAQKKLGHSYGSWKKGMAMFRAAKAHNAIFDQKIKAFN
jgi:hypothetical protein